MELVSHCLVGEGVFRAPSPNTGELFEPELPDTILLHYTACSDCESALSILCSPIKEVSAHLLISRSGEIFQLVPFNRIAWHAGVSAWHGRQSLNTYSIGIELDNLGKLDRAGRDYLSWQGDKVSEDEVFTCSEGAYWHRYTEEQLVVLEQVIAKISLVYSIKEVLRHQDVAPERKQDPGPAFPTERFVSKLSK